MVSRLRLFDTNDSHFEVTVVGLPSHRYRVSSLCPIRRQTCINLLVQTNPVTGSATMADAPDTAPGKQQRNRGKKRKNLGKKHRAAKRRRKEREEEESREALAAQAPATHTVPPSGLSFLYAVYMNDSNNINFYLHPGGSAAKVEQGNPASTSSSSGLNIESSRDNHQGHQSTDSQDDQDDQDDHDNQDDQDDQGD